MTSKQAAIEKRGDAVIPPHDVPKTRDTFPPRHARFVGENICESPR